MKGIQMKKLNTRRLKKAHSLITAFHHENIDLTFDVPCLLQYCFENDLRLLLKDQKYTDNQIDVIFKKSGFNVSSDVVRTNKVKLKFIYNDFNGFHEKFMRNMDSNKT